jgi:hypothetical protein
MLIYPNPPVVVGIEEISSAEGTTGALGVSQALNPWIIGNQFGTFLISFEMVSEPFRGCSKLTSHARRFILHCLGSITE